MTDGALKAQIKDGSWVSEKWDLESFPLGSLA